MTFQLAFNIFIIAFTFYMWVIWGTSNLFNTFVKIAFFASWAGGAILIAQHFGYIVKV